MQIQAVHHGERTMSDSNTSKEIGYEDWDEVVKVCEKEFELIDKTRIQMDIAEKLKKSDYDLALKERAKYPKPKDMPSDNSRLKPSDEELSQAKK